MSEYPKTKYHKLGGGSISVYSQHQERFLGDDWVDNKIQPEPVIVQSPKIQVPEKSKYDGWGKK